MAGLEVNSNYRIEAGQTVRFAEQIAVLVHAGSGGSVPSLTVAGTLIATGSAAPFDQAIAIFVSNAVVGPAGPAIVIEAGGLVRAEARTSHAVIGYDFRPPAMINNGRIEVVGSDLAWGVKDAYVFDNRGVIDARSQNIANGVQASFGFTNSGVITAVGDTAAYGVNAGQWDTFSFANTGRIIARDSSTLNNSVGVYWGGNAAFVNDGWIEGDLSLRALRQSNFDPSTPNTFTNNGVMVGKVDLSERFARLTNNGEIRGEVALGIGNDTYAGGGGSASGMVSGGGGNDSLSGGAGFDNFQGNAGNDTASGGDGADWVVGGKDNDSLSGDAGDDLIYGNLGADTCDGGAGADIVRGGQDDDVVLGGAGDDFVSGDKGSDTMTGGAGADVFHTFGDAGLDRVTDFSMAQGDRVQLDPGTQYTVSQSGENTVIHMTNGQMVLVGVQMSSLTPGWIFGA